MTQSNAVAGLGHNNPQEPTPFDLSRDEIDGLYDEAKNWLDKAGVKSDADADGVSKLLDLLRKAEKLADENRKEEKRPHDDAAKAVQSKWKPILDRAALAIDVCKKALTPFLAEKERKQALAAEAARREAEDAEIAAQKAFEQSGVGDLEAREAAEKFAETARAADKAAGKVEKQKAHAKGGSRAIGLRTSYRAEITNETAFARFVWQSHRAKLTEFLAGLAQRLVNAKQREIPGVTVHEEKEAA